LRLLGYIQGKVNDLMPKLSQLDWNIVIFADTICDLEGRIIEKPGSVEEASEILKALSGKWH